MIQPIRKPFFDDPMFPLSLTYKDRKLPQNELPEHLHDRYELVYVHGGKGMFFINQTFYTMEAGDLFVIPGNTVHRAQPDEDEPVTSTAVFFSPFLIPPSPHGDEHSGQRLFEEARRNGRYKFPLPENLQACLEEELSGMEAEFTGQKAGYRQAASLILQTLFLQLSRHLAAAASERNAGILVGPPWMRDTLSYLDGHYEDPGISLSLLAGRVPVSAAHFSRVFKQLTGLTVTDYVHAKRIALAKDLLLTTDASVDRIAETCGFASLPHFHRLFRSLVKETPGAYRRNHLPK
ncbi:AraC family transcriptional regulator [Paenibacillus sp. CC-CFT747]|nr:AraC family transcriptional regulator [Paenibacillus sp. CC-CFT747]